MFIGGNFINAYWLLFYKWLLFIILLMIIGYYSINAYWWILYQWISMDIDVY
jgi:hypothetical protein